MIYFLTTIHVIVCLFLIIVVLLQSGKAADLAGAFRRNGFADGIRAARSGDSIVEGDDGLRGSLHGDVALAGDSVYAGRRRRWIVGAGQGSRGSDDPGT